MGEWSDLKAELEAWRRRGRRAAFWWRDDDAVETTPALERLLGLAGRHGVPLMLAVIPARATPGLVERLARGRAGAGAGPGVVPVQHGFAHRNHAPAGERKWELGTHRPLAEVLEELARGRARMAALFGPDWCPVLVPPWNRIAPEVTAELGALGYSGLSTLGPRAAPWACPGVRQVNTHLDIMRWAAPRGFLGTAPALAQVTAHLKARRDGTADPEEPTGILTHHLAHDAEAWDFLDRLLGTLRAHPAAVFEEPRALIEAAPGCAGPGMPDTRGAA